MPVASKARETSALIQAFQQTQDVLVRQTYVERINALWPEVYCQMDAEGGLRVWYTSKRAPRALEHASVYLEQVQTVGARVTKDLSRREFVPYTLIKPTIRLSVFDRDRRQTIWDLVNDEGDWL